MNTITIPKNLIKEKDLVILPRRDYLALFRESSYSKTDWVYEKPISKYIQGRIAEAEKQFKKGKATLWYQRKYL